MIAHILGNGPSKKDFTNHPIGDVYGCNLADADKPLTASFIMDKVVIHHLHNNRIKLNFPIIVSQSLLRIAQECDPRPTILDTIPHEIQNGESTGHHAVQYLLKKGYTKIHMWGFDSLYLDTVESDSHTKIPEGIHAPNNWNKWRVQWDNIFKSADAHKCRFIIHGKPSS
jgi:hypothetical protein